MKIKKSISGYEKHIVKCPNCGKDILDHMKVCPFCKEVIMYEEYSGIDPAKAKRIKLILTIVFVAIIILLLASKYIW